MRKVDVLEGEDGVVFKIVILSPFSLVLLIEVDFEFGQIVGAIHFFYLTLSEDSLHLDQTWTMGTGLCCLHLGI